jgi:hypothetical protein
MGCFCFGAVIPVLKFDQTFLDKSSKIIPNLPVQTYIKFTIQDFWYTLYKSWCFTIKST